MNTTFTIPEGYELKQVGDNQFEIVKKDNCFPQIDSNTQGDINRIEEEQMRAAANAYQQQGNLFSNDDSMSLYHNMYQSGSIPGLNKHERELLEFCHKTDMRKFLKEEVGDKPIDYDKITGNFDGAAYYGWKR